MSTEGVTLSEDFFKGQYDASNALMLPSSKTKSSDKDKKVVKSKKKPKQLTKKQRKALEKIVKRRNDKKNRADLLEELKLHALPDGVYKYLTPLVHTQQQSKKSGKKAMSKQNSQKISADSMEIDVSGLTNESFNQGSETIDITSDSDSSLESDFEDPPKKTGSKFETKPEVEGNEEAKTSATTPNTKERRTESKSPQVEQNVGLGHDKIKINDSKQLSSIIPHRMKDVQLGRSKLPIIGEEQVIMEAIKENLVIVLAGETGSGKTTQVPQFLYEAGYASNGKIIGITEPRRIAAIAMSQRVSKELNLPDKVVSYQIRFEGNTSKKTKIKFMTDGVLLKEMEKDFLLSNYSVICIDEAHERSLYTDILIGLLSRTVIIRNKKMDPLRVVIMSATMRVQDFTNNPTLFRNSPSLIHIPVRQFPVHIHFNKITPENYLVAARKKVTKIHTSLPEGGILVFLTGQDEVKRLVKTLRQMFSGTAEETTTLKSPRINKVRSVKKKVTSVSEFDLNKLPAFPSTQAEGEENESSEEDVEEEELESKQPMHVVPLYSMLSIKEQEQVFTPPPPGVRLCVVATNVAETSLTIPGIRYVVDCGKVKLKLWDKLTGVQKFEVTWCSKASAQQRAGRAGRTGPGHCYRLFSSSVFTSDFSEFSTPEIAVRPVDDMVLLMKSMSINQVRNFPYPTHPGAEQLKTAEDLLVLLGALEIPAELAGLKDKDDRSRITPLGKTIAYLPVSPRYSKMLAISFPHSIVEYVITLVAALSVQEVLLDVSPASDERETGLKWRQIRRKWGGKGSSLLLGDCMVLLRAIGAFELEGGTFETATRLGLHYKSMLEIRKLRKKLTADINLVVTSEEILLDPHMKPPNPEQSDLLRQIILSGCPDRIAKLVNPDELTGDMKKLKHAYWCGELEEPAFIYESSVLRGSDPEWVVYQESFEYNGRIFLKGITAIEPEWIPQVCPVLCKTGHRLLTLGKIKAE